MSIKYFIALFLLVILILLRVSNNSNEYFAMTNNLNLYKFNKEPWTWFDPQKQEQYDKMSVCFNNNYFSNLNNIIVKIVNHSITKIISLSIENTTKTIHNLVPVSCLLSRFMLGYMRKQNPKVILHVINSIGHTPGRICSQKTKYTSNYIYEALQIGLSLPVKKPSLCPCDAENNSELVSSPNINWIMKVVTYPIKLNKNKSDTRYVYNVCILILSIYIINKKKTPDLIKLGRFVGNPILYFQVLYDLITNSYEKEIGIKQRDLLFVYYLKHVSVTNWMKNIDIDKLATLFITSGVTFIQNNIGLINKFPVGLINIIKKQLSNHTIETFVDNKCNLNDSVYSRDMKPDDLSKGFFINHIQTFAESPELKYINNSIGINHKKDFIKNRFNFNDCDAENQGDFIKHVYFYSQYIHHLKKNEFLSLIKNEFTTVKMNCKEKNDLWKLYEDTQNLIDGHQNIDEIYNHL